MNHGGMDHGGMDHGGGHGGMDHGDMGCKMNMVWNTDTTNLCILTSSWRITSPLSLYFSLLLISFFAVVYEFLRLYIRRLDARIALTTSSPLAGHRRRASLLLPTSNPAGSSSGVAAAEGGRRGNAKRRSVSTSVRRDERWITPLETRRRTQIWRSSLYAVSIGLSFGLMLISMTFNAWVIGAIVFGKCFPLTLLSLS